MILFPSLSGSQHKKETFRQCFLEKLIHKFIAGFQHHSGNSDVRVEKRKEIENLDRRLQSFGSFVSRDLSKSETAIFESI